MTAFGGSYGDRLSLPTAAIRDISGSSILERHSLSSAMNLNT